MQAAAAVQHFKVELLALVVQAAGVQRHPLVQIILQHQELQIAVAAAVVLVTKRLTRMGQTAVRVL
jgi:hypothetical protein